MKSYLFTTENDRGGVMLCDIDDFDEAVEYLCDRFDGVVRVEAGEQLWQLDSAAQNSTQEPSAVEPVAAGPAGDIQAEADLFA